jgi:hypothetical protein
MGLRDFIYKKMAKIRINHDLHINCWNFCIIKK